MLKKTALKSESPVTQQTRCDTRANSVEGRNISISVTGFHGTNSINSLRVTVKIWPFDEISDNVKTIANSYVELVVGTSIYNLVELSKRFLHLSCIRTKKFELKGVKLILGQDTNSLMRPLEYKCCRNKSPMTSIVNSFACV